MSGNRILVTGGAGYIGSHTCKLLRNVGYIPVTYDNLVYGHKEAVKWGPFVRGNILDRDRLIEVIRQYEPSAVMHFAAFAYVGESVRDPGKYYNNNVIGSINLLEAMRQSGCNNIIFSSTCATFGIPASLPITEETPQSPINPYGHGKLMIEQILKDYDDAYGIKHMSLRYFNAAGADIDGEVGEDHTPETHLIPLVLEAALGKREHIEIFGTDYETIDGTAIRDYIHVTDLADAHVKALKILESSNRSYQLNIGTGTGTSVSQIVSEVEAVCNVKLSILYRPRRNGDPPALIASSEKAQGLLNWKPKYSSLHKIVETAWKWHRKKHRTNQSVA